MQHLRPRPPVVRSRLPGLGTAERQLLGLAMLCRAAFQPGLAKNFLAGALALRHLLTKLLYNLYLALVYRILCIICVCCVMLCYVMLNLLWLSRDELGRSSPT